jgi:hypothetical protein
VAAAAAAATIQKALFQLSCGREFTGITLHVSRLSRPPPRGSGRLIEAAITVIVIIVENNQLKRLRCDSSSDWKQQWHRQ